MERALLKRYRRELIGLQNCHLAMSGGKGFESRQKELINRIDQLEPEKAEMRERQDQEMSLRILKLKKRG